MIIRKFCDYFKCSVLIIEMIEGSATSFPQNYLPNLSCTNLIFPKFHRSLWIFTFVQSTSISVYLTNNSSLRLYHSFAHHLLACGTYATLPATLARQICKANSPASFRHFLKQQRRRTAAHTASQFQLKRSIKNIFRKYSNCTPSTRDNIYT